VNAAEARAKREKTLKELEDTIQNHDLYKRAKAKIEADVAEFWRTEVPFGSNEDFDIVHAVVDRLRAEGFHAKKTDYPLSGRKILITWTEEDPWEQKKEADE